MDDCMHVPVQDQFGRVNFACRIADLFSIIAPLSFVGSILFYNHIHLGVIKQSFFDGATILFKAECAENARLVQRVW
jgi:hypothetical protein